MADPVVHEAGTEAVGWRALRREYTPEPASRVRAKTLSLSAGAPAPSPRPVAKYEPVALTLTPDDEAELREYYNDPRGALGAVSSHGAMVDRIARLGQRPPLSPEWRDHLVSIWAASLSRETRQHIDDEGLRGVVYQEIGRALDLPADVVDAALRRLPVRMSRETRNTLIDLGLVWEWPGFADVEATKATEKAPAQPAKVFSLPYPAALELSDMAKRDLADYCEWANAPKVLRARRPKRMKRETEAREVVTFTRADGRSGAMYAGVSVTRLPYVHGDEERNGPEPHGGEHSYHVMETDEDQSLARFRSLDRAHATMVSTSRGRAHLRVLLRWYGPKPPGTWRPELGDWGPLAECTATAELARLNMVVDLVAGRVDPRTTAEAHARSERLAAAMLALAKAHQESTDASLRVLRADAADSRAREIAEAASSRQRPFRLRALAQAVRLDQERRERKFDAAIASTMVAERDARRAVDRAQAALDAAQREISMARPPLVDELCIARIRRYLTLARAELENVADAEAPCTECGGPRREPQVAKDGTPILDGHGRPVLDDTGCHTSAERAEPHLAKARKAAGTLETRVSGTEAIEARLSAPAPARKPKQADQEHARVRLAHEREQSKFADRVRVQSKHLLDNAKAALREALGKAWGMERGWRDEEAFARGARAAHKAPTVVLRWDGPPAPGWSERWVAPSEAEL